MSLHISDFSKSLVKIAKEDSKNYLSQMASFAPAAAIQAAADVPKGFLDGAIENKVVKGTFKDPKGGRGLKTGIGRGTGRLAAGLVTTPLFIKGIQDLSKADTRERKNKAFGKVLAAGGLYAGIKGMTEGAILHGNPFEKGPDGKRTAKAVKSLSKIKGIASVRGALGIGSAALTAKAVADNIKKTKGQKGFYNDVVKPALAGFGIGAAKGAIEKAYVTKSFKARPMTGAALGRGVSGAMGALILDKITKSFTKKASIVGKGKRLKENTKDPFVSPSVIYSQIRNWSMAQEPSRLKSEFYRMQTDNPERSPTSRAVYYAMYDVLKHKNVDVPKPKLIDKVHPPESHSSAKGMALLAAAYSPKVLSEAVRYLPKSDNDKLMQDALDNIITTKGMTIGSMPGSGDMGRYFPDTKLISLSSGASAQTLAHEAGHNTNSVLRKKILQSATSVSNYRTGSMLSYLIPLGAMALSSERSFATKEELKAKSNAVKTLGVIAGAMTAPLITEEALANLKGIDYTQRAARRSGAPVKKEVLKYVMKQAPRMASYMSPLLAPLLTARYFENRSKKL